MNRHPQERKPKVVLVDDERDFLTLVKSWLQADYQVAAFSDALGAAESIGALEPDLVVLDVHMPSGSGFDLCRWLRATPEFADMPIVFLTGARAEADFSKHLRAGGTRFLTKPIDRRDFLEAIAEELSLREERRGTHRRTRPTSWARLRRRSASHSRSGAGERPFPAASRH
jgi:CheY-like chemotaxis protein